MKGVLYEQNRKSYSSHVDISITAGESSAVSCTRRICVAPGDAGSLTARPGEVRQFLRAWRTAVKRLSQRFSGARYHARVLALCWIDTPFCQRRQSRSLRLCWRGIAHPARSAIVGAEGSVRAAGATFKTV